MFKYSTLYLLVSELTIWIKKLIANSNTKDRGKKIGHVSVGAGRLTIEGKYQVIQEHWHKIHWESESIEVKSCWRGCNAAIAALLPPMIVYISLSFSPSRPHPSPLLLVFLVVFPSLDPSVLLNSTETHMQSPSDGLERKGFPLHTLIFPV